MKSITANWKECVVSHEKLTDDGLMKKVKEAYVVDGVSFGDAEAKIVKAMEEYGAENMEVLNITPTQYKEIFFSDKDDADKWFKVRLSFITIDERTEREKKTPVFYLVQAGSFGAAKKSIDDIMGGTMIDYSIAKIEETKIIDVINNK